MCENSDWAPGECATGTTTEQTAESANHVEEPQEITYDDSPPTGGAHRPEWAKWGEYDYLSPERWVHNLEHGGVVFLYNPCADDGLVDDLRSVITAQVWPGGDFRYILTPYPGLDSAVAVVSWGWLYEAECVDEGEIEVFIGDHYRTAPEDVSADGQFDDGWLGRP
jgi:hypothetical protein